MILIPHPDPEKNGIITPLLSTSAAAQSDRRGIAAEHQQKMKLPILRCLLLLTSKNKRAEDLKGRRVEDWTKDERIWLNA